MYQKVWNKSTLEELKKEIIKQKSDSKENIYLAVQDLEDIIKDLDSDYYEQMSNPFYLLSRNIRILNKNEHYHNYVVLYNYYVGKYIEELNGDIDKPNKKFDLKDLLELSHSFYKSLDPEIYKIFYPVFKNSNKNLNFLKPEHDGLNGYTWFIKGINKPFFTMYDSKDYDVLLTFLHEYGHSISFIMNPERSYSKNLLEIESYFLELIGEDFFENYLSTYGFISTRINRFNYLFGKSEDLLEMKEICKNFSEIKEDFNKKSKTKEIAKKLDMNTTLLNQYLSIDCDEQYLYTLSSIIAINLYSLYQKDPEYALNELKKIILFSKDANEYKYFKEKGYLELNNTDLLLKQTIKRKNKTASL